VSRLSRWGLPVGTMVSVAAGVLLVSGWGSALASSVTSVLVTNPASKPVPVRQQGPVNVNVTNASVAVHDTNVDSSGNLKVHEQGTASVAQSGSWNVGIVGTPAVKSGDVASVLDQSGCETVSPSQKLTLNPNSEDVSAYREVTIYLQFCGGNFNTNAQFVAETSDGSPYLFAFDNVVPQGPQLVETYDPAPATLQLQLWNTSTTSDTDIEYTIVGRTN